MLCYNVLYCKVVSDLVSEAELPTLDTYLPTLAVQDTELGDMETMNMLRSSWIPLPDNYTTIE